MVKIKAKKNIELRSLLADIIQVNTPENCMISGIAEDSRLVQPGDLFFARSGMTSDGRRFINDAVKKGAKAILVENELLNTILPSTHKTPILIVPKLSQHIGQIASRFYGEPSAKLDIVGITGTNGKTSCSHYIAQLLQLCNHSCAVMGTVGVGLPGQLEPLSLTTPDPLTIQYYLAQFKEKNIDTVAMEVSSHALAQYRVDGIEFDIAVLTNITRDHLDYHSDMQAYTAAKTRLFHWPSLRGVVINMDDPYAEALISTLSPNVKIIGYSLNHLLSSKHHFPILKARDVQLDARGIHAVVHCPWGTRDISIPQLGHFNLANCLAALASVVLLGHDFYDAIEKFAQLHSVPGRMQCFKIKNKASVVVDFAHTPNALDQVLSALSKHSAGKIWCVIGCGGDRDRGKRAQMASVVESYNSELIITNDNPRSEDPKAIVTDMISGLSHPESAYIEYQRERAIVYAFDQADENDIVLVAGKGHETYQLIGENKIAYNDAEFVQSLLGHGVHSCL